MKKERIVDIIAFLFILLFIYTAASKLFRIDYFKAVFDQTAILKPYAGFLQWFIPVAEILISFMLVIGKLRLSGLYGALALMLAFTAYVASILAFSDQLPCSCGGVIEQMGWRAHLFFNTGFSLLAVLGIWLEQHKPKKAYSVKISTEMPDKRL